MGDEIKKYIQAALLASHYKQKTDSTCGIASCLMLFNARLRSLWISPLSAAEYELLTHSELIKATKNRIANIFKHGLSIREVSAILNSFKCSNTMKICKNKNDEIEINKLRKQCMEIFKHNDGTKGLIVNYFMRDIGQPFDYGHHSPICAYNQSTDRVLLLDCWIESSVCWVKVKDLYNAMATKDDDSGENRGYIVVNNANIDLLQKSKAKL